ncbi:MAG TPA: multicopper oxidase domain-containing protein, partial [Ornithinibacter sp.]|nr:multicopper oxidase domain-containing protein [Ornithinibacter sp.]
MEPISRRGAVALGGLGALTTAVGIAGLAGRLGPLGSGGTASASPAGTTAGDPLRAPTVLSSEGGRLDVRLEAARGTHPVAGRSATTLAYNGEVPGPTLRLRAGDRLRLELVNSFDEPTNLHLHGLHVSPEGNADNVFVEVAPGESFSYEYQLPADHPSGTYWYHPHHHGMVADQLFAGLYGAIVVEEQDPLPVSRERLLVVSDITLGTTGEVDTVSRMERMMGREGALVLVNGQLSPTVAARPGEREHWRVVNACSSRFLSLEMEGMPLVLLGRDSGRLATPSEVTEVFLAPGNRADLVVTASDGGGVLRTAPVDRGTMMGAMMGGRAASASTEPADLMVVEVDGPAVEELPALPRPPAPRDLS